MRPAVSPLIEALRAQVGVAAASGRECVPFGVAELDARIAGGGLTSAALHEVSAARPALAETAAATLFLAGIVARLAAGGATALWVVTRFDLFAPGLEQVGLGPDRVVFVEAGGDVEVLAVMEDALRHGGLAAVVGEVRRADMTASRRLQLASAEGGTMALLHRQWRRTGAPPFQAPSAAMTRWSVGCTPSAPLGFPGVGRARWDVGLVRQRGGDPFAMVMEGCDAQGRLARPAAAADRAAAPGVAAKLAA